MLLAAIAPITTGEAAVQASTTIYVGAHFEVREHDQPVKFVLQDKDRIARIIGTLSPRSRLQRLRLRVGWNSASIAVNAPELVQQLLSNTSEDTPQMEVYRWEPSTRGFQQLKDQQDVVAGSILWIHSKTARIVTVSGEYSDPVDRQIQAGGIFAPSFGLETWDSNLPNEVALWKFDSNGGQWQIKIIGELSTDEGIPKVLAPGEAIYVRSQKEIVLAPPSPQSRVRYYHGDHLGSSAVITDAEGKTVEETAYYPFAIPRNEYRPGSITEPYNFTGMERDRESALFSFGARFYDAALPRFTRADPLTADIPMEWLSTPQKLNAYAYVANNPVNYVDPTGLDGEKARPAKVLIVYGYDMFEHFDKAFGGTQSRQQYAEALKRGYAQEAGEGAKVVVKHLESKKDLEKVLKGSTYDTIIFNTHGYLKSKAIRLSKKDEVTPGDLARYLGNNNKPRSMYFYGCNTAKTGFAEDLSGALPDVDITGATDIIGQSFTSKTQDKKTEYTMQENRIYNKTFRNREATFDARKATISDELPRD